MARQNESDLGREPEGGPGSGCQLRPGRPEDSAFLARFAYLAARSQLARGIFDLTIPGPPGPTPERLARIEQLVLARTRVWLHWSLFLVAEVAGTPAAGLAAYDVDEMLADDRMRAAMREAGWTAPEIADLYRRLEPTLRCAPSPPPGAWTIDHVATLPDFRRRGLASALLAATFKAGRKAGFREAQLDLMIGNTAARQTYDQAGFSLVAEYRHPDFERALGCPGIWRMSRPI